MLEQHIQEQPEEHTVAKQPTVLEKLRDLDEQRQALAEEARTEAMQQAEEAIEILNSLNGPQYYLASGATKKASVPKKQREMKGGPCPICDYETNPPHDRRAHRSQEPKEPFTVDELEERGMERV